jgi:hypothetical protein
MIEPLEDRIAPAAILNFTDAAGDSITVKASKGTNTQLATAVVRSGGNITAINLSNAIYEGSNFSITATIPHGGHGPGTIAVPAINATGTDLGIVSIDGDVGSGTIGSDTAGTPAVKSFTATSIGLSNSSLGTLIFDGVVPSFATKGDIGPLGELRFQAAPATVDILHKATIGGGIVGGTTADGGTLVVAGGAGSITVKGEVIGGSTNVSGSIVIEGSTLPTKISVGALTGGDGNESGSILALGPLGAISVARNITGGNGTVSGSVISEGNIASVSVGGAVLGDTTGFCEIGAGANIGNGVLASSGNLDKVHIAGSAGGSGIYTIAAHDDIGSVGIAGDSNQMSIDSGGNTGSVTIGGNVFASTINPHGTGSGLALGSVAIHGGVHDLSVDSGGVVVAGQSSDANATIGKVTVAGGADSMSVEGGTVSGISSEITSVSIGGPAIDVNVLSNFIAKLTVGGASAPLIPGANNDNSTFAGVAYNEI